MKVGTIAGIRRYPVKSMGGESLDAVTLASQGLPGDRVWAVRDEIRGGIRGAKKIPGLMALASRLAEKPGESGSTPAEIRFPDGSWGSTGDEDIHQRISDAVGHPVSLWPLLPPEALDHYRRGAPNHPELEAELREMFGRLPDEPLPDLGLFPRELLEFECPPGTYFDAFPLLLLTTESLAQMEKKSPESRFDPRRFRPNLLVTGAAGSDPFPERDWRGERLRIGGATLQVTVECPRCVMVTHGFEDLPQDRRIMRALVREAGGSLGVYATVEEPGPIRVGDAVERLPARSAS